MQNVIVLGAGNMGSYIANDLSKDYKVTSVDNNLDNLENINKINGKNITTLQADLSDPSIIPEIIKDSEVVIAALPEKFGYDAVKASVMAGKNVVDISFWSFFKDDINRIIELDNIAREKNTTVIFDSGIAPGISNGTAAYLDNLLNGKTKNLEVLVGGNPLDKIRGFFASWSVEGLIEEYTRDAVYIKNGELTTSPALFERKYVNIESIGKLEAALTDGLRSLSYNLKHIPNKKELTLRYRGHYEQMEKLKEMEYFIDGPVFVNKNEITTHELSNILMDKSFKNSSEKECKDVLKELGFFDESKKYTTENEIIIPRKVAADILSKKWKMNSDDRDMLVMRIIADDEKTEYTADFYAQHDGIWSAMAKTTGGTAALSARIVLNGDFSQHGAFPLEHLGKNNQFMNYFIEGLKSRGVKYNLTIKKI